MIQILKTSRIGTAGSIRVLTLLPKNVQAPPIVIVPPVPRLLVTASTCLQIKKQSSALCSVSMRVSNSHSLTGNILIAVGYGLHIKGDIAASVRNLVRNTFATSFIIHRLRLQCSAAIHIRVHDRFTRRYSSLQHVKNATPNVIPSKVRIYKVLLEQKYEFIN